MLRQMLIVGLLLSGLPHLLSAAESEDAKESKGPTHTSKREQRDRATTVDFNKDLGLGFDSLTTLGARIDQARKSPDPVGLANAASELAIAEKVSEKNAKLTSAELWKESIELAELRRSSAELKALSHMVPDETAGKHLAKLAIVAEKDEADSRVPMVPGAKPKGIGGFLTVVNRTNEIVTVYVNGLVVGNIFPGLSGTSGVFAPYGTTVLTAQGNLGGFWTKTVAQIIQNDIWVITE